MHTRFTAVALAIAVIIAVSDARGSGTMSDSAGAGAAMPGMAAPADTVLQLEALERRVLERNPGITAARAARDEARARVRLEGALEPPMVEAMLAPASLGARGVEPAWRVEASQSLPVFGQRRLRRRAAEAEGRVAAWELRAVQLDLVHEARIAWAELWRIQRALELQRATRDLLEQLRHTALTRYSAGLVGQQDPLAAEAELTMADHQLELLERERRRAEATLDVLMHLPPGTPLPPPPRMLPVPDTSFVHESLAPEARAHRPELRAADARLDAERARAALAGRSALPEPALAVAYDRFMNEPQWRAQVGVRATLPLAPGRTAATRAVAAAALARTAAGREVAADSVELQVEEAAARLHEQAHDLGIMRGRMVPLAERTVSATRSAYASGRTELATLLGAMRDLLRARLDADASLALVNEARADLDRALGVAPPGMEEEP